MVHIWPTSDTCTKKTVSLDVDSTEHKCNALNLPLQETTQNHNIISAVFGCIIFILVVWLLILTYLLIQHMFFEQVVLDLEVLQSLPDVFLRMVGISQSVLPLYFQL